MMFEIFTDENVGDTMTSAINQLFGYPKGSHTISGKARPNIKTEIYRKLFKHQNQNLWAGAVDDALVDKCKNMSKQERETYYIAANLKDYQYFIDNDWFKPSDPP